jgi:hypothetical protein
MPDNADSLWQLANHLYKVYKDSPAYVRVLNLTAETLGGEAAIRLLPRLCFLALQTDAPTEMVAHLSKKIASERAAARLCDCTPRQFCDWAAFNVTLVSKSLRERDTPLKDHPWMRLFGHYFDAFERISSVDDRLTLLMGLRGGETFQMFRPTFTVFEDGDVLLSRTTTDTHEEEERELWITITSDLVEGLRILQQLR